MLQLEIYDNIHRGECGWGDSSILG